LNGKEELKRGREGDLITEEIPMELGKQLENPNRKILDERPEDKFGFGGGEKAWWGGK